MTAVLFIDDDPVYRELISAVLRKAGYDVDAVDGGEAALEHVLQLQPEVVVCDLAMPMMDGSGTVRRLRSLASMTLVPVVFLGGRYETVQQLRGFSLDMDTFIHKGSGPQVLLDALKTALDKRDQVTARVAADLATVGGFTGDLSMVGPAVLLALADREGFTGELELYHGEEHARLLFRDGALLRAVMIGNVVCMDGTCVFRVLDWSSGRFRMCSGHVDASDNIRQPTSKLLQAHAEAS
jgi:CheY-like chemotaxis protein